MTYPAPPRCLIAAYSSRPDQKGGTLIAEDVLDLDEHHRRLCDPDAYRPTSCLHCGNCRIHAHDFRDRRLRADPSGASERIRRYLCPSCRAVWQVLPAFIARFLHRRWPIVQSSVVAAGGVSSTGHERHVSVPRRTVRRWLGRLRSSALVLTQALAGVGAAVDSVLTAVGVACSRGELVDALAAGGVLEGGRKLEQLAGWVHRMVPGIRLM